MSMQTTVSHGFEIEVSPSYVSGESRPDQAYYFFAYKIKIKNTGSAMAQLTSRHWVITDGMGRTEEVRGPGVVGLQPKIQPGHTFEYESACPLTTPCGSMKGFYSMVTEQGQSFQIEIPEFFLIAPNSLH